MAHRATRYLRRHGVALLALFVALSSGAFAAVKLPAHSVGTKQLKNKAVTPAKLAPSTIARLQGKAGPKGDKGDTGLQGPAGAPGQDGKNGGAVRVRARKSGGDVTVPGGSLSEVNIPLSDNTWTQGASELDQVFAQVTVTAPATCGGPLPGIAVTPRVDGHAIPGTGPSQFAFSASTTKTVGLIGGFLIEPGADTPHTLTLVIQNGCDTAGQDYTVTGAAIDVGAFL